MYLVVGLGNPGKKYDDTRHNVGFVFLDKFPKMEGVVNVRPDTFMNSSGEAVKKALEYYKISPKDLWVIHDDLDLKLGEFKIHFGKGPKLHGGINSIEDYLKTDQFWRVRIGVDNRDQENKIPGEEYVLQRFNENEKQKINEIIKKAIEKLNEQLK